MTKMKETWDKQEAEATAYLEGLKHSGQYKERSEIIDQLRYWLSRIDKRSPDLRRLLAEQNLSIIQLTGAQHKGEPSAEAQAIAEDLSEKLNDLWPSDMVPLIADALEDYAARKVATQREDEPSDGAIYAAHSRRQFSDAENAVFDEALRKVGRVVHEGEIVPTKTEDLGMSDNFPSGMVFRPDDDPRLDESFPQPEGEPSAEALHAARQMFPMQNLAEDFYDRVAKSMDAYAARKVAVAVAAEREKASKVIRDWISEQKRTGADEWHSYGFNYFEALAAAICNP
jgi:hypothetical protein